MRIEYIKPTTKYIIFVNDAYYQSTGYERPGEFGSKVEFVNVVPFEDEEGVHDWIAKHPNEKYKVVSIEHLMVKTTTTLKLCNDRI